MKTDQLIIALDVEDFSQARKIVQKLSPPIQFYKVGLRLFTREGPPVVQWLKKKGLKVFLDLKLHDIPNTVAQAVESACRQGVDFLTLHALGGEEMMHTAVDSATKASKKYKKARPKIFAVTILTSHQTLKPLGISGTLEKEVWRLAELAKKSKVDGLVCSPLEVKGLKNKYGQALKFITPGIRLDSYSPDDQKRTASPQKALLDGADYLVIGRPILNAAKPREVIQKILRA